MESCVTRALRDDCDIFARRQYDAPSLCSREMKKIMSEYGDAVPGLVSARRLWMNVSFATSVRTTLSSATVRMPMPDDFWKFASVVSSFLVAQGDHGCRMNEC